MILYPLIPTVCMIIGGMLATLFVPKPSVRAATQHFAAGVVFAAVAIELLPALGHTQQQLTIAIGFLIGVFSMLSIKWATGQSESPVGLLSAVGVDIAIDGLLIGIAFEAGRRSGDLITTALAIEILFLGLATTAILRKEKWSASWSITSIILLSLLIPLGYLLGISLMHFLPASALTGVIAFGIAALLFLVTEELLLEAHEIPDRLWVTACFFIGFLVIVLLEV